MYQKDVHEAEVEVFDAAMEYFSDVLQAKSMLIDFPVRTGPLSHERANQISLLASPTGMRYDVAHEERKTHNHNIHNYVLYVEEMV